MRAEETFMETGKSPGPIGQERPAPLARLQRVPPGTGVAA